MHSAGTAAAAAAPPRIRDVPVRAETAGAVVAAAVAILALRPIADPDFWWHLAAGQHVLDGLGVVWTDPYSPLARGRQWIAPSWLPELAFAALERLGGLPALVALSAALAATTALVLFRTCRTAGARPSVAAGAVVLAALCASFSWDVRPHVVSALCLALVGHLLVLRRTRGVDHLWQLVPVMALWANSDVIFPLGGALIAVDVVAHPHDWGRRSSVALAAALGLATLATPYHWHLLAHALVALRQPDAFALASEFQTPTLHAAPGLVLTLMFFATALAMIRSALPRDHAETARVLLFAALAYATARHMPFFAIVAAPALARHADALLPRSASPAPAGPVTAVLHVVLVAMACLGLGLQTASLRGAGAAVAPKFPVGATRFLAAHPDGGRVLTHIQWGGWVIHALAPRWAPCIDGRTTVHGEVVREYRELATMGARWRDLLDRCEPTLALWPRDDPFARVLELLPEWHVVYADAVAIVFARREERR